MRELGEQEVTLHEMVGRYALDADLRLLITVGQLAGVISETAAAKTPVAAEPTWLDIAHFDSTEDCEAQIGDLVRPGDKVLVKGSRAMRMERIVARLVGEQTIDCHG
jgi:UDP-N-acetylmuramoyl-tripeptide--D-alanyl-D-alanine ligase